MSLERNKALARRLYEEVFGAGNLDTADEILAPDFVNHGPGVPPVVGTDGIKRQAVLLRTGLTMADVQRGLAVSGGLLTALEIEGVRYHLAPETLAPAPAGPRVHLLPGFDQYLLGYGDRTAALAADHSAAVVPGGNGMFKPTVVADGEVVGTWRRTLTAGEVVIEPLLWGPLRGELREALVGAVDAYGAFLGRPTRLA